MPVRSAGILLHRTIGSPSGGRPEVLLVHPGGPFWAHRDAGAWSIPKGEIDDGEDPVACARREFAEELGLPVPEGELVELGEVRQKGGKRVLAWALEGDLDAHAVASTTFTLEWPRGSGHLRDFPEVDRAEWFELDEAAVRILEGQRPFLEALARLRASTARSSTRSARSPSRRPPGS